jgi:cytochrome bd-type quinol oxidase subunit 1
MAGDVQSAAWQQGLLLWPKFIEHAGPIIGIPFSWQGAAFFLEAIALEMPS